MEVQLRNVPQKIETKQQENIFIKKRKPKENSDENMIIENLLVHVDVDVSIQLTESSPVNKLEKIYREVNYRLRLGSIINHSFKKVQNYVECTTSISWPESRSFLSKQLSKNVSKLQNSIAILDYLKNNKYLSEYNKMPKSNIKDIEKLNAVTSISPLTFVHVNVDISIQLIESTAVSKLEKIYREVNYRLRLGSIISHSFKNVNNHVECTTKISWPESRKFLSKHLSKKDSKLQNSIAILDYLKNNKYLSEYNKMPEPIIQDVEKLNAVTSISPLIFTYDLNDNDILLNKLTKLYPKPRKMLQTVFADVCKLLNVDLLGPYYTYKQEIEMFWTCLIDVKWPEPIVFIEQAQSRKDSGTRAAYSVLKYLKQINCIDDVNSVVISNELRNNQKHTSEISNFDEQINFAISKENGTVGDSTSENCKKKTNLLKLTYDLVNSSKSKASKKYSQSPAHWIERVYENVAKILNNKIHMLKPIFRLTVTGTLWECEIRITWPDDLIFIRTGRSKKKSKQETATEIFNYLHRKELLTKDLLPIIYNCEKAITHSSAVSLKLSDQVVNNLFAISKLSNKDFVQLLKEKRSTTINADKSVEHCLQKTRLAGCGFKNKDLNVHLARESTALSISNFKNHIISTVQNNRVVIIKGEPGCGKSTRVPQYVMESWATDPKHIPEEGCDIIVTEPRRIAAITLSERVAAERNERVGTTVGFQIRFETNFSPQTGRILYCTTGILLKRLQSDPLLHQVSHVILDEAHERDVNTDLLLNLLRIAIGQNPNLKILIMSATINAEVFEDYFKEFSPQIINVPGLVHPVTTHFLSADSKSFPKTLKMIEEEPHPFVVHDEVFMLIEKIHKSKPEGGILCFLPGWDDILKVKKLLMGRAYRDMAVMCLHSKLQSSEQRQVFYQTPPGIRKVVLSTNIAETSVTVDDVVYVINTGIQKQLRYDVEKDVRCINPVWISRSSAAQRRGRAGRCQPGECFHLFTRSKHDNDFSEYSVPEIKLASLTKVVLDGKVYSNNMPAVEFFEMLLSPPDEDAIKGAVNDLKDLELLDENEHLTPLGRTLSGFQLEPKMAKALFNSVIFKCTTPIVDIVTLFDSELEVFSGSLRDREFTRSVKMKFATTSDHLAMMRLLEKWLEYVENNQNLGREAREFCNKYGLVEHKMITVMKMRGVHYDYLEKGLHKILSLCDSMSDNDEIVKGVLLSGIGTLLRYRNYDIVKGRYKKADVLLTRNNQKATLSSRSVLSKTSTFPTNYLLYINETKSPRVTTIFECSVISPLTILLFMNKKLEIRKVPNNLQQPKTEQEGENIEVDENVEVTNVDRVILRLVNTKYEFLCDRRTAEVIVKAKENINDFYQYYVYQLTTGNESIKDVDQKWDKILVHLNQALQH